MKGPDWTHELLDTVLARMDVPLDGTAPSEASPPASGNERTRTGEPVSADENPVAQLSAPQPANDPRTQTNQQQTNQQPTNQQPTNRGEADAPSSEPTRRLFALPRGEAPAIRRALRDMLGRRIEPSRDPAEPWTVQVASGSLLVEFDLGREDVLVDGPASAVEQFAQVLTAVARPGPATDGTHQRVMGVAREVQPYVQAVMRASRQASEGRTMPPPSPENAQAAGASSPFRLAASPQQGGGDQAAEPEPDLRPGNGEPPPDADRDATTQALPQLEGIEVEPLPELDAIILRGRDKDIGELTEIIEQLEALSRETRPAIEVIPLRFSQSAGIAEIIDETQESLIGTRQGRAQVVPLGKPNAMLLIGWGEAVNAFKELIAKLDQQVTPETQFDVFRLKYATATDVQQSIEGFFDGRPEGMEPTIQSTVDGRTNSLVVHAAPRDMAEVARLIERLDSDENRSVQRTRVFPIRNSIAADVAETLEQAIESPTDDARGTKMELMIDDPMRQELVVSGILENIQVTVDSRKNSLLISAPAENFELIEALIRQLDSEGMVAKIKIFPIEYGDAASLVETLRALLPSQESGTTTAGQQISIAPGESSLAPLRFTVDARSNSIIASGSEGDLRIVDALIVRLDESDTMQRKNMVYQLKNSPAVDVALAINEFLRTTRQVEEASPGTTNPFQQLEKEVVVVPEPVSNKLVLSATPRYFEEIEALIEKLDEQPPQVMIQVLIAEVTLGNTEEFGVELGIQDSVLFDRSLLGDLVTLTQTSQTSTAAGILTETEEVIIGAENTPGFDFNSQQIGNSGSERALEGAGDVGGQGLSNFSVGRTNSELGFGGLVLSANSQNVNVLLRALQETRRLEILSRPQVLTLDNQPAFIQVGQRVPRIVGSSINQIGQQNQIALENVGLILGVTPRISPEGNVVMEIDAEKSNIGPESEGIPISVSADGTTIRSPRVDVASAQATVSAADGETIILGGLITTEQQEIHRKVPVLGDMPLLKYVFRFDSVADRRSELLIILTPHVIRTAADAERLKQVETARMNWCAGDVFDLHGEVLANPEMSSLIPEEGSWEVIYPDVDPRGEQLHEDPTNDPNQPPSVLGPAVEVDPLEGMNSIQPAPQLNPPNNSTTLQEPPRMPEESSPPSGNESLGSPSPARSPEVGRELPQNPRSRGDRP